MHRWIRGSAGAALVVLLAACNTGGTTVAPDVLDLITPGTLTIGSDMPYAPFEFNDEAGNLTGFDVELVEEIADRLELETEWVNAGFDTIFTSLDGGQFDLVASAVTAYAAEGNPAFDTVQDRREIVAFSVPYYSSLQSLVVNTEETPEITTVEELPSGAAVGVQRGTTGKAWAEQNIPDADIKGFPKAPQMFEQLDAGQLVGVVVDLPVALEAVPDRPALAVVQQLDTGEEYGLAVQQDNPDLLEAINGALQDMFADGTYASIFREYFPDQELPSYAQE